MREGLQHACNMQAADAHRARTEWPHAYVPYVTKLGKNFQAIKLFHQNV